jgi:hypothetical protein
METDKKLKTSIFNLNEASVYAEVSTRTIERHAVMTGYKVEKILQNGRKVNGYSKTWLDRQFKNVVSDAPKQKPNNQKVKDKTDDKKNVLSDFVSEQITFLKQEVQFKNELIVKLQDSNNALIESEQKTKMLLADLQIQQKALLLPSHTAKPLEVEKIVYKESRIYWALFVLLVAVCGVSLFFGFQYIQAFINSLK